VVEYLLNIGKALDSGRKEQREGEREEGKKGRKETKKERRSWIKP
jgi:hypothetical protein